jgi:hypothetical protein
LGEFMMQRVPPRKPHSKKTASKMIKEDSIVYYKDDITKHPYLVHQVLEGGSVVLGLRDFPEVEQDFGIPQYVLGEFGCDELKEKEEQIYNLING